MRDFFIRTSEKVVAVFIALLSLGIFGFSFFLFVTPAYQGGGALPAILTLVFGSVYVFLIGGLMYLGFGIYHNTKRTTELLEALNNK